MITAERTGVLPQSLRDFTDGVYDRVQEFRFLARLRKLQDRLPWAHDGVRSGTKGALIRGIDWEKLPEDFRREVVPPDSTMRLSAMDIRLNRGDKTAFMGLELWFRDPSSADRDDDRVDFQYSFKKGLGVTRGIHYQNLATMPSHERRGMLAFAVGITRVIEDLLDGKIPAQVIIDERFTGYCDMLFDMNWGGP